MIYGTTIECWRFASRLRFMFNKVKRNHMVLFNSSGGAGSVLGKRCHDVRLLLVYVPAGPEGCYVIFVRIIGQLKVSGPSTFYNMPDYFIKQLVANIGSIAYGCAAYTDCTTEDYVSHVLLFHQFKNVFRSCHHA